MMRLVVGLSLIFMILVGLSPSQLYVGYGQEDTLQREALIAEINLYIEVINRILDVVVESDLTIEASNYIDEVGNIDLNQLSIEELIGIRDTLRDYFEELKSLLPETVIDQEEIEKALLEEVIQVLSVVAEKYNASSVEELYNIIVEEYREGNYTGVMEKLTDISLVLNQLSIDSVSRELVEDVVELMNSIMSDGENASRGLRMGIEKVYQAMDILNSLRNYLEEVDADPTAILAVDLAIATLESSAQILEEVASRVGNTSIPGLVENTVNNTMAEKILKEIGEYRWEVDHYLNISFQLEAEINISNKTYLLSLVNEARLYLNNASVYLDISENLTLEGNLTGAMLMLRRAEVSIDYAESILEDVAKVLDIDIGEPERRDSGGVDVEWLLEEVYELREEVSELRQEVMELNASLPVPRDDIIESLINRTIRYLDNATMILDRVENLIVNGSYVEAYNLFLDAKTLYELASENLDYLEEIIENGAEEIEEILDEILDLREDILELRQEAEELWNRAVSENNSEAAAMLEDAMDKLSQANNLLEDSLEVLDEGNVSAALELLQDARTLYSEAKAQIIQARTLLNVPPMDDDMGEEDDDEGEDDDDPGMGSGGPPRDDEHDEDGEEDDEEDEEFEEYD